MTRTTLLFATVLALVSLVLAMEVVPDDCLAGAVEMECAVEVDAEDEGFDEPLWCSAHSRPCVQAPMRFGLARSLHEVDGQAVQRFLPPLRGPPRG